MDYILLILILQSLSHNLFLYSCSLLGLLFGIEEHVLRLPNGVASLLVVTLVARGWLIFFSPDCSLSNSFLRGFVYMVQLSTRMEAQRFIQPPTGRHCESTDSKTGSSLTFPDSVSVRPKCFNGDARMFKEWCFSIELALRSRNIEVDFRQAAIMH